MKARPVNERLKETALASRLRTLVILLTLAGLAAATAHAQSAWVLTGDYSQFGRLRSYEQASPFAASADLATTPGDAVGRLHDGRLYVVGRGGASLLQVYDPQAGMALVREFSLGAGRNPQDIAFDTQGRAFVSCYDQAVLLRVDVDAGAVAQTYSTAAFADSDGLPETAWMLARGDRLFIACQKLDRADWYSPTGPGALLVFDMAAGQWVDADPAQAGLQPVTLAGGNPYTRIESIGVGGRERLRIGCVGWYGALDGGIDEVDPEALASLGYVATEAQLGGDLSAFTSVGPQNVWAIVADVTTYDTNLVRWQGGPSHTTPRAGVGFVFADLAWDGGCRIFLADRTPGADGLRAFDACTGAALNTTPVATGLPPFSFVLTADPQPAPAPLPPATALRVGAPFPNPCNPAARFDVEGPAGQPVDVTVVDLAGRAVARARLQLAADGRGAWAFDGRDDRGRALPAGVYRVVMRGPAGTATRPVTLLK